MEVIMTKNLTKQFRQLIAVDHLTFSVQSGEVFGFLGPNGAGKTTTIRLLTGQTLPSAGTATVAGFDIIKDRQQMKSHIGVVFEFHNLYERISARDNLNFTRKLYGVDKSRVEEVLSLVDLRDRANERVKNFSNGMKQRLLIARALLPNPEILFLDEPTRGLDPSIALDIRNIISRLATEGHCIFLTTHYMEEADRLCDRIAILDKGKIVDLAAPETLKSRYGKTLEDVFITLTKQSEKKA
jgi:ABC-2 type transport system ATP-binding protein